VVHVFSGPYFYSASAVKNFLTFIIVYWIFPAFHVRQISGYAVHGPGIANGISSAGDRLGLFS